MATLNIRTRSGFPKIKPLLVDPDTVPVHDTSESTIPISTEPITKEEYLAFVETLRGEPEFDRLPFASWAYETFPEFSQTPEQVAAINEEWTRETLRAKEKDDLEAEKAALEKRIQRLKKMARKNKAIQIAKQRIVDILARQEEMRLEEEDVETNIA